MANFCSECGKALQENEQFCAECGAQVAPKEIKVCDEENLVGKGPFFWLLLLFSIPFFGFIASIVFSCAPRNKSLKNFSRAVLIWYIIGIVIAVVVCCLFIPAVFGVSRAATVF